MIISPPMKLVIFGGGNMGAAFARGFLRVGGLTAEQVTLVEHNAERAQELKSTLPCSVLNVAPHSLVDYQVIFIAVKPQSFVELAKTLRVDSSQLVVSIMAGITIAGLTNKLSNATRVVRAMPNTPSQIGAGVTAWVATDQVTADDRNLVEGLLSAGGKVCLL